MQDIQKFIEVMSQAQAKTRSNYHLTLGGAIEQLRGIENKDLPVEFDFGGHPDDPDSYRGYYSDLAIDTGNETVSVEGFTSMLESAVGSVYTGYKGGDFKMTENTPLWYGTYGKSSGLAIVGLTVSDKLVTINTKRLDD